MGFFDDFWTGFQMPFAWGYDHVIKPSGNIVDGIFNLGQHTVGVADKVTGDVGSIFDGVASLINPTTILIAGGLVLFLILK